MILANHLRFLYPALMTRPDTADARIRATSKIIQCYEEKMCLREATYLPSVLTLLPVPPAVADFPLFQTAIIYSYYQLRMSIHNMNLENVAGKPVILDPNARSDGRIFELFARFPS